MNMCGVPHRRPEIGYGGAPGTNLSQTCALWKAPEGGAVDH